MPSKTRMKSVSNGNMNKSVSVELVRETETIFRHCLWKTKDDLKKLACEMVQYVENTPNCYSITHFLVAYKLLVKVFYDWVGRSDELAQAVSYCKQIITVRRENGIFSGQLPVALLPYMSMYCPEYKAHAREKAELLKQVVDANPTIRVLVDTIPASDLVKIKSDNG